MKIVFDLVRRNLPTSFRKTTSRKILENLQENKANLSPLLLTLQGVTFNSNKSELCPELLIGCSVARRKLAAPRKESKIKCSEIWVKKRIENADM